RVVVQMLIAVRHHRPAAVPPATAHDVHGGRIERVRRADDGADVEIVLPVLDRDVETVATRVEVRHDRIHGPVPVPVDHVAAVPLGPQPGTPPTAGARGPLPA